MSISETINQDLLKAMKSGDEKVRDILRFLKSALQKKEIDKRDQLTEEETIGVISKEIKSRKEAIEQFEKGDRADLAEKEKLEIKIISKYLPEQISEDEVINLIDTAIAEIGAASIADMGKVMGKVIPKVQGKFDSSRISEIVRQKLG